MNYISHLKSLLPEDFVVTEEANYEYTGYGTVVVVKYLAGNHYLDSTIIPIQLAIYTDDLKGTKTVLDTFTKTYNNTAYIDVFDYVKEFYSTPIVLSNFEEVGTSYTSQFIVSGTLVVSSDVSDIKKVTIDGNDYITTSRVWTYATSIDNQKISTAKINKSHVKNAVNRFGFSMVSRNNSLTEKIRRIKRGELSIDSPFEVVLTFTENDTTETYTMKLESANINSENQGLPVLTVSFIE